MLLLFWKIIYHFPSPHTPQTSPHSSCTDDVFLPGFPENVYVVKKDISCASITTSDHPATAMLQRYFFPGVIITELCMLLTEVLLLPREIFLTRAHSRILFQYLLSCVPLQFIPPLYRFHQHAHIRCSHLTFLLLHFLSFPFEQNSSRVWTILTTTDLSPLSVGPSSFRIPPAEDFLLRAALPPPF